MYGRGYKNAPNMTIVNHCQTPLLRQYLIQLPFIHHQYQVFLHPTSVNNVPPTRFEYLTNQYPDTVPNTSDPYNVSPVDVILIAIPPKRSIFISRLPAETTTENIDRYILS